MFTTTTLLLLLYRTYSINGWTKYKERRMGGGFKTRAETKREAQGNGVQRMEERSREGSAKSAPCVTLMKYHDSPLCVCPPPLTLPWLSFRLGRYCCDFPWAEPVVAAGPISFEIMTLIPDSLNGLWSVGNVILEHFSWNQTVSHNAWDWNQYFPIYS